MMLLTHGTIWRTSLLRLRADWRQVFSIHLTYVLVGIVLYTPLIAIISHLLLSLSDQPALADQDIAWLLLTPPGILTMVLLASLGITIIGIEQASLIVMGVGSLNGRNISAVEALRHTMARAPAVFSFATRLVVRVLLLTLPFIAAAGLVAWFFLTDYDINYYLSQQPTEYWAAVVIIGLLLLAMVVLLLSKLLAWSMALPLVLIANIAPARSFAESERFTRGNKRKLIRVLILWALLAILLNAILLGVIQQLGAWVVPNFLDSINLLVPVLGFFIALWVLGNYVVTVFTAGALAYLLVAFYEQYKAGGQSMALASISRHEAGHHGRLTAVKISLVLGVATITAMLVGNWLMDGIKISDKVTVVAHRGAAGTAPENTLASIRQAIKDGADWVEIDVQESADGEVVVIHDSDFMKLAGINLKVWDATLEQMRSIDIGSWFDPRFSAQRVPTLDEVLEEVRGKAKLLIELKYYGHDQQLEQRVINIVESLSMEGEVAIMSLKYAGIQKISALRPGWTYGLLSTTAMGNLAKLDINFLAVSRSLATPAFVHRAHEQDKQVLVWTINDAVSMSRMMSLGVDGIITDEPALATEVVADRKNLNPAERLLIHTAMLFGTPVPKQRYRDDSP